MCRCLSSSLLMGWVCPGSRPSCRPVQASCAVEQGHATETLVKWMASWFIIALAGAVSQLQMVHILLSCRAREKGRPRLGVLTNPTSGKPDNRRPCRHAKRWPVIGAPGTKPVQFYVIQAAHKKPRGMN